MHSIFSASHFQSAWPNRQTFINGVLAVAKITLVGGKRESKNAKVLITALSILAVVSAQHGHKREKALSVLASFGLMAMRVPVASKPLSIVCDLVSEALNGHAFLEREETGCRQLVQKKNEPDGGYAWMNLTSVFTLSSFAFNILVDQNVDDSNMALLVNLICKVALCFTVTQHSKRRILMPLNVLSYASLYLPHGQRISALFDLSTECINAYYSRGTGSKKSTAMKSLLKQEPPTSLDQAYEILGVPENEKGNMEPISARYQRAKEDLEKRIARASSFLKKEFEVLMFQNTAAYELIKKSHE